MPRSPANYLGDVARHWSLASGVAALILGGLGLAVLVLQSAKQADSETRSTLMDLAMTIERLETELVAETNPVPGDLFAEFIAESDLVSRADRLDDTLATTLRKLTKLPEGHPPAPVGGRIAGMQQRVGQSRSDLVDITALVGGHIAAMQQRIRQLRSDLVEARDLRSRMFGTMDELVRAPDVEPNLYAAVVGVVAAVHGHVREEILPAAENLALGVARLRDAAADSAPGTAALAAEFATLAAALAERRMAVQGKLEEIHASARERRGDFHRLVEELQTEWWEATKPPAWVVFALVLPLLATGIWTASAIGRYRDVGSAPAADSGLAPTAIVAGISAEGVSAAAHEILEHLSTLRLIPQYSSGSGTLAANAVRSVRVLGAAIERTAAGLGRVADTAIPARSGEAVALARCVDGAVAAARKAAGGDVAFEVSAGAARVLSSTEDVRLMLDIVLANAAEAAAAETRTGLVRVSIEVDADRAEAAVVVTDDGPGMTKWVRDHAFNLFFTTKANRPGAGLAVARRLATKWGGSTSISQLDGSGATVRISLPLATDDTRKAEVRWAPLANRVLRPWRYRQTPQGTD